MPRSATPAETGAALEDLARAILKDAAAGHLGSDLRVTADEILLADGLAAGDGAAEQRGGTTEWDLTPVEPEEVELGEELEGLISGPTGDPEEAGDEQVSELDARITPEPSPEPQEAPVSERAREIFGDAVPEPERGFEAETGFERERRFEADEPTTSLELVPAPAELEAESGTEMFDYEADQRRLVDDDGRPRPASPVLRLIEQTRAEREARDRARRRALPGARDDRVERARHHLRPQPSRQASRRSNPRLPPITPGRAGRVTGPDARWLRPFRAQAAASISARSSAPEANRYRLISISPARSWTS